MRPTHAEIITELVGKSVGDFVDLVDGTYTLNVFEYKVEGFRLVAKFNAAFDDKQLNFDSMLFPEEVATAQ